MQVQPPCEHRQFAFRCVWPHFLWFIAIQLDAVAIGITQVEGFAAAVVCGTFQRNRSQRPPHGSRKRRTSRVEDGGVVKPRGAGGGWGTAKAFPRDQCDVMMIPARRQEDRTITVSLSHFKPKYARVEPECPLQVSNFQVNVSNSNLRVNGEGRC